MPFVVRGTKKRVLIVAYKGKRDKLYDYILGYCREHGDIDPNNVESLVNAATVVCGSKLPLAREVLDMMIKGELVKVKPILTP